MILEHKTFDLFGKMVFEKAIIKPPFSKPNPMQNEACFLYIMEGIGIEISESEIQKVSAKESVLMKCGNYIAKMESSDQNGVYSAFAVHFYPDVLRKIYKNDLPGFLINHDQIRKENSMAKLSHNVLIEKFIREFTVYFDHPHMINEDLLTLKLKEIILLLYNSSNSESIQSILSNLFSPRRYSFQQIIESHQFKNISVEELASLCNMSISSFKREFKKIYHDNPASFLRKMKLNKAKKLLETTELRINEISMECGFEDISHFSKTFHKLFSKYPTEYRKSQMD